MLLCVDVGNTNVTLGVYAGETLQFTARMATETGHTDDQYAVDLKNILLLHGLACADVDGCILCSVVPSVGHQLAKGIETLCGIKPMEVGPGIRTGLNIRLDDPASLGADLVAGAVGALHKYPMPCIMIDMGTATTLFVLDEQGTFIGGAIAAGVRLTLRSLTQNTAQLPSIRLEAPKRAIGRNTADCMKSGLMLGTASMLDGLIDRMQAELTKPATVVATGGLSEQLIGYCAHKGIIHDPYLLLEGLRLLYEKNR